jgi:ribonuclease P protein component
MSLPRRSRLSGKEAFSNVFQHAVVSTDASFKVLAHRTGLQESRLGMAVSRQVDKRAVERNRLKRIVRESFRRHYLLHAGEGAIDIVVLPRQQAVSVSNRQLFEQLTQHWQRIDERILK